MKLELYFSVTNYVAIAGWLLLLIAPYWKYSKSIVQVGLIPILLSIVYLYLITTGLTSSEGGFGTLADVGKLFENQQLLLAGWVHYLAFDLWVGTWVNADAAKRGIHRLLVIPCLFFTFMFGPIGLLLYLTIRAIKSKAFLHYDNF